MSTLELIGLNGFRPLFWYLPHFSSKHFVIRIKVAVIQKYTLLEIFFWFIFNEIEPHLS